MIIRYEGSKGSGMISSEAAEGGSIALVAENDLIEVEEILEEQRKNWKLQLYQMIPKEK